MAEKELFTKVQTDDIVLQVKPNSDYEEVFLCVIANEEIFVLAKPRFKLLEDGGAEIVGYHKENCKIYENNAETMAKNHFEIA